MFTENASTLLQLFLSKTYDLFQVTYPGTNVSIWAIYASAAAGLLIFKVITTYIGFTAGDGGEKQKGGNSRKRKISKERKGDEK